MKVTVAKIGWEEVDLIDALENFKIAWDYDIITGVWGETYYPAEEDDIFLEINQEILNRFDGSIEQYRLIWLECSSLLSLEGFDLQKHHSRKIILQYLKDNIHRAINTDKVGDYW
ncbi:TPA: hypothetical protein MCM29_005094 [Klebsiella pneumoniae]|nr:hypothetical protein [Klebsiella pneumoniae]